MAYIVMAYIGEKTRAHPCLDACNNMQGRVHEDAPKRPWTCTRTCVRKLRGTHVSADTDHYIAVVLLKIIIKVTITIPRRQRFRLTGPLQSLSRTLSSAADSTGLYSYGLYSYGLRSYGLYSYGLRSYGLYS